MSWAAFDVAAVPLSLERVAYLLMQRVERVILQLADVSEIVREAQAGRNFS